MWMNPENKMLILGNQTQKDKYYESPCVCVCVHACAQLINRVLLCDPMGFSPLDSCAWDSPGKSTGVGCHFLLQGIFLTQGLNLLLLCLLHWQADFFTTLPSGKPFIYMKTLEQAGSQRKKVNSGH